MDKRVKVDKQDVLDYIVAYEHFHRIKFKVKGIYPSSNLLSLVFPIGLERARQIRVELEGRYKKVFSETKAYRKPTIIHNP